MRPGARLNNGAGNVITSHAAARMQQRGIDELTVILLQSYGREEYQQGEVVISLDKKGAKKLMRDMMKIVKNPERLRKLYLVESGETLITAAHKTRHHKRD